MTNIDVVDTLCKLVAAETGVDASELLALKTCVKDRPGHDMRYAIDASKIMDELGYLPRESFETGLKRTIEWYLQNEAWWRPLL